MKTYDNDDYKTTMTMTTTMTTMTGGGGVTRGGGRATAMRAMATEGEQQSTSDGIDKDGWWLARERQRGDHTTTTVGDDER